MATKAKVEDSQDAHPYRESVTPSRYNLEPAWRTYLALAREEQRKVMRSPGIYPHYCEAGNWIRLPLADRGGWNADGSYDHGCWTAGLTVGQRWLLTLDASPQSDACLPSLTALMADIASRADDSSTGDLGMLFYPAIALGDVIGRLSVEERASGLAAADQLRSRFKLGSGHFQAIGEVTDDRAAGITTIDTLMMMPLLYWADSVTGQRSGVDLAHRHALFIAENLLRTDGSTAHMAEVRPDTGEVERFFTTQGNTSNSCWSRGQSWAIAGFAWAYGATADPALLQASERAWEYFESHLAPDGLVPWDLTTTETPVVHDASASAVAAFGLLLLSDSCTDEAKATAYRCKAEQTLLALADNAVSADGEIDGVLQRACYSKPAKVGVNGAIPAGDYHYGLALAIATGRINVADLLLHRNTREAAKARKA